MHTRDVNLIAGGTTTLIATANNTIIALLAKLWGSWSEVHCQQQQTVQVPLQVPQEGEHQDPGMDGEAIFVTGRGGVGRGKAKNLWGGAGKGSRSVGRGGAVREHTVCIS